MSWGPRPARAGRGPICVFPIEANWRGAGAVERACLENMWAARFPGFESLPLRINFFISTYFLGVVNSEDKRWSRLMMWKDIIEALIIALPFSILVVSLWALTKYINPLKGGEIIMDHQKRYWLAVFAVYILFVLIIIAISTGFIYKFVKFQNGRWHLCLPSQPK